MRICSLLPSATEIVCALGLEDALVGVSHECDYPPSVRSKPALIRPRVDAKAPAAEIDRQVRELIGRGESLYAVDAELLLRLEPDLILTQDLCHVCAASPDDLAAALARAPRQPRVLLLSPRSLCDVWNDIRAVGEATGRRQEAADVTRALEERAARVARFGSHGQCLSDRGLFSSPSAESQVATVPPPRDRELFPESPPRPRVVCLEWLSPFYVAGHWVPEMVEIAGGRDVLGRAGKPSFQVSPEQVIAAQPEVVLIMPCGYGLKKAAQEFAGLALPKEWADLPAVRAGRVFALDANSYFSRPGPRLADGVELLARLLWPQSSGTGPVEMSLQADAVAIPPSHG